MELQDLEMLGTIATVSKRQWGHYEILLGGPRFQVKRLRVLPEKSLSIQSHFNRHEHWVVVKGTAKVLRGSEVIFIHEGQSVFIAAGDIHSLSNPGTSSLEIIETQVGPYLGEDDITRYDGDYELLY